MLSFTVYGLRFSFSVVVQIFFFLLLFFFFAHSFIIINILDQIVGVFGIPEYSGVSQSGVAPPYDKVY